MKSSNDWRRFDNPGSKSNHSVQRASDWLQLPDHGLEAVRILLDSQVGNPKLQILLVLEEIGLLRFLSEAWVWQEQEICQEFVEHWDSKTRTTTVHGTKIDLSLNNVLDMSGFGIQWTTKADRSKMTSSSTVVRCATIFPVQGDNWSYASIASCKDDLVRDLLVLLSKTLWFPSIRQPSRAPRELIYRVLDALDGAELNWAKCVYTKFLAELKRLQILRGSFSERIRTLAGPLMYFLYTRAKREPESFREIVQYHNTGTSTVKHLQRANKAMMLDREICASFSHTKATASNEVQRADKAMIFDREESATVAYDKVAIMKLKSDDLLRFVPAVSTVQTPEASPKSPPTRPNKKRRPVCEISGLTGTVILPKDQPHASPLGGESTPSVEEAQVSTTRAEELAHEIAQRDEEILRLQLAEIDTRLKAEKMERLYLEEQKHVQRCMKLHFASLRAEEEVADLKAKVSVLRDEKRELEKREGFLELQLADTRRRWETAIVRAELAEIQAAEKSCLLLRLLNPTGK